MFGVIIKEGVFKGQVKDPSPAPTLNCVYIVTPIVGLGVIFHTIPLFVIAKYPFEGILPLAVNEFDVIYNALDRAYGVASSEELMSTISKAIFLMDWISE